MFFLLRMMLCIAAVSCLLVSTSDCVGRRCIGRCLSFACRAGRLSDAFLADFRYPSVPNSSPAFFPLTSAMHPGSCCSTCRRRELDNCAAPLFQFLPASGSALIPFAFFYFHPLCRTLVFMWSVRNVPASAARAPRVIGHVSRPRYCLLSSSSWFVCFVFFFALF